MYYDRKLVEACRCHQPVRPRDISLMGFLPPLISLLTFALQDVARYFKLLALCHTVLINHKEGMLLLCILVTLNME